MFASLKPASLLYTKPPCLSTTFLLFFKHPQIPLKLAVVLLIAVKMNLWILTLLLVKAENFIGNLVACY